MSVCSFFIDNMIAGFYTIRNDGKPEKPPNSGYSLYSKQLLSSGALKAFESKERMTEISRMWKELSEEEKNDYNERAQAVCYKRLDWNAISA